jgi:hypothetical protein
MSDSGHAARAPRTRGWFAVAVAAEAAWLLFLAWMALRGG